MFSKIKNLITAVAALTLLAAPLATPAFANAQVDTSQLCCGAQLQVSPNCGTGCNSQAGTSLHTVITDILNIISVVVGITAVIMIILGGFKYIVSGGESGRVSGAKDTILFAIVGLVVVALAQIIVHFVLNNIGG